MEGGTGSEVWARMNTVLSAGTRIFELAGHYDPPFGRNVIDRALEESIYANNIGRPGGEVWAVEENTLALADEARIMAHKFSPPLDKTFVDMAFDSAVAKSRSNAPGGEVTGTLECMLEKADELNHYKPPLKNEVKEQAMKVYAQSLADGDIGAVSWAKVDGVISEAAPKNSPMPILDYKP